MLSLVVIGRFLAAWFQFARPGISTGGQVSKWVMIVVTFIYAVNATEILALSLSDGPRHEIRLGLLVTGLIILVWLAIAAGAAWVQTHAAVLRLGARLNEAHGSFLLAISNNGFGTVRPRVDVARIVDENGRDYLDQIVGPREVRWRLHGSQRPEIARDRSEIALPISIADRDTAPHLKLNVCGGTQEEIDKDVPYVNRGTLWLNVEVWSPDRLADERWYGIAFDAANRVYRLVEGKPRFLTQDEQWHLPSHLWERIGQDFGCFVSGFRRGAGAGVLSWREDARSAERNKA
jgi:hypothetical protein